MITLRINKARLTVGDVIKAEQGIKSTSEMVEFLTKFVTNGNGEYLPEAEARQALLALSLDELPGIVSQLADGIKGLTNNAVPLPTATN